MENVRFYFSFRSPYSWFAFRRIEAALSGLPVALEYVPVFPPKDYKGDHGANSAKRGYIDADVERFARAYGLELHCPNPFDTEWIRPHAAYLFAQDQGCGRPFALAAYSARFAEGRDLGSDDVLREVAQSAGLNPTAAVSAADDPAVHERVRDGMAECRKDGMFGVPFFVYRGQRFWGNDRIEWLVRAIHEALGRPVPDLQSNPLARPCAAEDIE
jgi:2-hydroxychromene-2-carboxylate isomerase